MNENADLTKAQKRTIYRAEHRGTKEMDWLLGRFVKAQVTHFNETEHENLDCLLEISDRVLEGWIMGKDNDITPEFCKLIDQIKQFHDLT